ncbi:MAG: MFS transporter [Bacteroides sp.]|nr:MFS transporter [Bacteroides sp.]
MNSYTLKENGGIKPHVLWILTVIASLSVANLYYSQPLLKSIAADFGCSEFLTNMIAMCTQIGYTAGLLFIIPLCDLVNRKRIIQLNMSLLVVSLVSIFFAPNVYVMLIASVFTGFGSVSAQIFVPLVAQCSAPSNKVANMGIITSGLLIGVLASRVISGIVGDFFGWRSMFIIAAVLMSVSLVFSTRILPDIPSNFNGSYGRLLLSIFTLLRQHPMLGICASRAAMAFGAFSALWACLAFRIAQPPFSQGSDLVGLLGLCGMAGAFTATFAGRLMNRIGVRRLCYLFSAVMLAGWAIIYLFQNHLFAIIVSIILIDMGVQAIQVSNQTTMLTADTKSVNRINTIFMTSIFIGGSLGTFLAGCAWQSFGWLGVCAVASLLIILSVAITFFTRH